MADLNRGDFCTVAANGTVGSFNARVVQALGNGFAVVQYLDAPETLLKTHISTLTQVTAPTGHNLPPLSNHGQGGR
jgi:hypothetical protein